MIVTLSIVASSVSGLLEQYQHGTSQCRREGHPLHHFVRVC
jgi:hypothetical protein